MSWFYPKEQRHPWYQSSNHDMASLLKDLDKLEAAYNNSNKPIAKDKDNSGSLVDVY